MISYFRHPSNLMLDRLSGKILHIDFGDCFEVAMTREKFPEKIPFRLTRMLIHAMEVIFNFSFFSLISFCFKLPFLMPVLFNYELMLYWRKYTCLYFVNS